MKTLATCRREICFLVGGRSKRHGLFEILIEDSDTKCQKMEEASAVLAQSRCFFHFLEAAQQPESSNKIEFPCSKTALPPTRKYKFTGTLLPCHHRQKRSPS